MRNFLHRWASNFLLGMVCAASACLSLALLAALAFLLDHLFGAVGLMVGAVVAFVAMVSLATTAAYEEG
jgi:hypothetical protein